MSFTGRTQLVITKAKAIYGFQTVINMVMHKFQKILFFIIGTLQYTVILKFQLFDTLALILRSQDVHNNAHVINMM